jgi:outer membrane receptor for ferrienterochelin and colicins
MLRPSRLLLPAALVATAPALAQEGGDAPPIAGEPATLGARSYTPADFVRFAPKTALDMLRQVPGFTIQQPDPNDLRRGLGQAQTNVLINGRRFSGKSNDVVTEVGRIAADNVVRIEIIDGATLDVPGLSGQVANIVTAARGVSGSFAWRPQLRPHTDQSRFTNGEASISGTALGLDYTVSVGNESYVGGEIGPELVFTPDGTIIDRREEILWFEGELPRLSVTLKREQGATVANLNAAIGIEHTNVGEISLREGPGQVDRDRRLDEKRRNWDYEIGGDYEFPLGAGRLKLIGLRRFDHQPFTQVLTIDFADGAPRTGDRFEQVADQAESILRSEYRWKAGAADWQLSAEGALNVLDIDNSLARIDAGSGIFVPVPLPGSSARVEEERAEVALSYGRPLSPSLSFQGSVGGEYSKLSQSSDNGLTRIFYRPKGFVSLAWKPSPGLDVSAKLERVVGQLNFFDFVASSNVSAGTTNASNPNLVPPQSWDAEIEATRSLGAFGTATARVYGRLITDIVDIIPIDDDGQAPGNLDRAKLYGVQWTSTFNFDPLGWRGAKLDLDLQFQKTELEDPVTGRIRGINETMYRRILANLRHDVPGTPWAYGMGYDEYRDTAGFRLDQKIEFVTELGNLSAFVEHKDVLGLTVRGTVENLLGSNVQLTRDFYDGRRTGPLLFTEDRNRSYGPVFTLAISGKI